MKIAAPYFEPSKDGSSRWRELLSVWLAHAAPWGHQVCLITDEPGEWQDRLLPEVEVIVLERLAPRVRPGGMGGLKQDFNRKGDLICRSRYDAALWGKDVLFLDLDAWVMQEPMLPLMQAGAFKGSWLSMARDANIKGIAKPEGWKPGPWYCGGIIFVRSLCPADWLRDRWIRAMDKIEQTTPGHYLQEQQAWSAIVNNFKEIGLTHELPGSFNCVPHLSHMRHSNPVIHHHHGPSKWKQIGK